MLSQRTSVDGAARASPATVNIIGSWLLSARCALQFVAVVLSLKPANIPRLKVVLESEKHLSSSLGLLVWPNGFCEAFKSCKGALLERQVRQPHHCRDWNMIDMAESGSMGQRIPPTVASDPCPRHTWTKQESGDMEWSIVKPSAKLDVPSCSSCSSGAILPGRLGAPPIVTVVFPSSMQSPLDSCNGFWRCGAERSSRVSTCYGV